MRPHRRLSPQVCGSKTCRFRLAHACEKEPQKQAWIRDYLCPCLSSGETPAREPGCSCSSCRLPRDCKTERVAYAAPLPRQRVTKWACAQGPHVLDESFCIFKDITCLAGASSACAVHKTQTCPLPGFHRPCHIGMTGFSCKDLSKLSSVLSELPS